MPRFIHTCEMWRTQTFIGCVVWTCCSIAKTHSFIFTGVFQTGVRLLAEGPRVLVVAVAMEHGIAGATLARAVAGAEAEQWRRPAQLRFDRNVESQAQPAQLRSVATVHSDEVVVTRGEPRLAHRLAIVHIFREKETSGGSGGAALKFLSRHIEQPDAVRPQSVVDRHQQRVAVLQLKRAYLRKVKKLRRLRLLCRSRLEAPTLGRTAADILHKRPPHQGAVWFGAPLE